MLSKKESDMLLEGEWHEWWLRKEGKWFRVRLERAWQCAACCGWEWGWKSLTVTWLLVMWGQRKAIGGSIEEKMREKCRGCFCYRLAEWVQLSLTILTWFKGMGSMYAYIRGHKVWELTEPCSSSLPYHHDQACCVWYCSHHNFHDFEGRDNLPCKLKHASYPHPVTTPYGLSYLWLASVLLYHEMQGWAHCAWHFWDHLLSPTLEELKGKMSYLPFCWIANSTKELYWTFGTEESQGFTDGFTRERDR